MKQPCPNCGKLLNADTLGYGKDVNAVPKPDDYSICLYCGCVLIYEQDLSRRKITVEEEANLSDEMRSVLDSMEATRRKVLHDKVVK